MDTETKNSPTKKGIEYQMKWNKELKNNIKFAIFYCLTWIRVGIALGMRMPMSVWM